MVLVRFPFSDYSTAKLRPALIISANNEQEVCVAFISSVVPVELEKTDFLLTEEDDDFVQTRLKKDSVFKMNKIATLDKSIILGRLGAVSEGLGKELDEKLRIALGV
ncbi:MAG: type II toxin-antitoxin system PemK/MazF family toxin [Nanoarchaeota archaeon]|nr:type II toxin-antitoxin system PemK/MazF family toxin [Nanoarchaeota archaeon]